MKCSDYHAGMLRQRAELQHADETALSGGATEITYTTYATVWAALKPLSGNEVMQAMRVDAQTRNRLVMRYRDDVRTSDRVIVDGRVYGVTFVQNVEYNKVWLVLDLDGGTPYAGAE